MLNSGDTGVKHAKHSPNTYVWDRCAGPKAIGTPETPESRSGGLAAAEAQLLVGGAVGGGPAGHHGGGQGARPCGGRGRHGVLWATSTLTFV